VVQVPGLGLSLSPDATRIVAVQAARAFVYGLGSVLIGVMLDARGLSGAEVGGVLAALLAGTAVVSVLLEVYISYGTYSVVLKWLTLSLFAYVGTVFVV